MRTIVERISWSMILSVALGVLIGAAAAAALLTHLRTLRGATVASAPAGDGSALEQLLASPEHLRCSRDAATAESESVIATYIASGMLRSDVTTTFNNPANGQPKTLHTHVLVRDGFAYLWSDIDEKIGRLPIAVFARSGAGNIPRSACEPWEPDPTLFHIPEGKEVIDLPHETPPPVEH